ncbi:MAG: ribosome assembly cofactor RimP [Lentimicrobiaceae bacterium]|jgi:ribosome maturation factor RimP|nr:ribosome assembly cofactor RimP [Lentimicrobiaceae bacterium]MDG1901468.1 ribosome assembly cofactor RimP [Bacteroidales bacterium]
MRGRQSPLFIMIDKKHIEDLTEECLFGTDRFVTAIKISTDNKVMVFIDGDSGVNIDNCVELSRHIEGNLDREKEDYELNVASAGADNPFVMLRQYKNNIDNLVQVTSADDRKIRGILKSVNDTDIELLEEIRKKNKKNKKVIYGEQITIAFDDIKETKRIISF